MAALLVDVSQTGLAAGLEFELFQPEGEQSKDFYAELPINIRVTGHYHEFGRFISGLAALPRIVTIHDVKICQPGGRARGGGRQAAAPGPGQDLSVSGRGGDQMTRLRIAAFAAIPVPASAASRCSSRAVGAVRGLWRGGQERPGGLCPEGQGA